MTLVKALNIVTLFILATSTELHAQIGQSITEAEKLFGKTIKEYSSTPVPTKIFLKGDIQIQAT